MYTMREICRETGMTYEGLKSYCNQGLVPTRRAIACPMAPAPTSTTTSFSFVIIIHSFLKTPRS